MNWRVLGGSSQDLYVVKKHGVRKSTNWGCAFQMEIHGLWRGVTNHLLTGMILQVFHWSSTWLTWKSVPWKADSFWKLSVSSSVLQMDTNSCDHESCGLLMFIPQAWSLKQKEKTTTERFLQVWIRFVNDTPVYFPSGTIAWPNRKQAAFCAIYTSIIICIKIYMYINIHVYT